MVKAEAALRVRQVERAAARVLEERREKLAAQAVARALEEHREAQVVPVVDAVDKVAADAVSELFAERQDERRGPVKDWG